MLFTSSILSAIVASSLAQAPGANCPIYQPCLNEAKTYREETCGPLMATNQTLYAACLCYNDVNAELCYDQCPDDKQVQLERVSAQQLVTAECGAANLNPKALPKPAPWVTVIATTSTASKVPMTASASSTATATAKPKNDAGKTAVSFISLLGLALAL